MKNIGIGARFALPAAASAIAGISAVAAAFFGAPPLILTAIILAGIIFSCAFCAAASGSLTKALADFTNAAASASKGNLKAFPETEGGDEIKRLGAALAEWHEAEKKLFGSIDAFAKQTEAGERDVFAEERPHDGAFREAAKNINSVARISSREFQEITDFVEKVAKGDAEAKLRRFSGSGARLSEAAEQLTSQIKSVNEEIKKAAAAYAGGGFSHRFEVSRAGGEWSRIVSNLNSLCETVNKSFAGINETAKRLSRFESIRESGGSQSGELHELKKTLAEISGRCAEYANEIAEAIETLANRDSAPVLSNDYEGAFGAVKDAINRASRSRIKTAAQARPSYQPEAPKPAAPAHVIKKPTQGVSSFTSSQPVLSRKNIIAPSASHVYDAKDFGKY